MARRCPNILFGIRRTKALCACTHTLYLNNVLLSRSFVIFCTFSDFLIFSTENCDFIYIKCDIVSKCCIGLISITIGKVIYVHSKSTYLAFKYTVFLFACGRCSDIPSPFKRRGGAKALFCMQKRFQGSKRCVDLAQSSSRSSYRSQILCVVKKQR